MMNDNDLKVMNLYLYSPEFLCTVAKALSSPTRIEILRLLHRKSGLIMKEIARELNIPASTAAMHINILNAADLIIIEDMPGTRGSTKICHIRIQTVHFFLNMGTSNGDASEHVTTEIPVGAFTACEVGGTCGLATVDGIIGQEDSDNWFYSPEKYKAGIVWLSAGYLEYKIPNNVPKGAKPSSVVFSMELCSEACGFNEEWKSDITFWVNGIECGMWQSSGDFGNRRGLAYPTNSKWKMGSTQYGIMVHLEINQEGIFINRMKYADITIDAFHIMDLSYVKIRLGNQHDATHIGGLNIFGKHFGDYNQDILMTINY